MRIALIAPPWLAVPPQAYGGTETVIDVLARGIREAGHDVLLCATGDSTCPVEVASTVPAALGTVRMPAATELGHVMDAYAAAREWGADIIHDHTAAGPGVAARLQAPAVVTNHGPFDGEGAARYRAICDEVPVIAISHHQASTFQPTQVAAVIHHGLDVDTISPGRGDGGFALFLGRVSPDKGVDVAARVARAAGVPLKIAAKVAEPAEREYFAQNVEPWLGEHVEFIGEIGSAEKYELLGSATCLLNPLRWAEPFGMVMIEALACGTPVIATPFGSVPEIVDHGVTGLLGDTAAGLVRLLERAAELDRDACRRVAEARFSRQRVSDDHLRFFRATLRGWRRLRVA